MSPGEAPGFGLHRPPPQRLPSARFSGALHVHDAASASFKITDTRACVVNWGLSQDLGRRLAGLPIPPKPAPGAGPDPGPGPFVLQKIVKDLWFRILRTAVFLSHFIKGVCLQSWMAHPTPTSWTLSALMANSSTQEPIAFDPQHS
jgi:hypothetical protein